MAARFQLAATAFSWQPDEELFDYLRDAARGLDYLHKRGIQHRDIKPHDLMLVGGGVRVADFSLAKLLEHTVTSHSGGIRGRRRRSCGTRSRWRGSRRGCGGNSVLTLRCVLRPIGGQ